MGSMRFQPQAISRLNLAHPLTRGLTFAWSAAAPDINLVNGRPSGSKGTPPARGPVPGSATGRIFANNGSIDFGNTAETYFGGQSQQTLLALIYVPNTGASDGFICGRVQGSWDYYLNISSGSQQVSYATGGNSSGIAWPNNSVGGGLQPIQGRTVPIVGTYDKTTSKIYIDGLLKNSRSETGSFSTSGDSFGIGARGGGNQSSAGGFSTSLILVFKRTLSDAEVLSLSQNPWQIFDDPLDDDDEFTKSAVPTSVALAAAWLEQSDSAALAAAASTAGSIAYSEPSDTLNATGSIGYAAAVAWAESQDVLSLAGTVSVAVSGSLIELADGFSASAALQATAAATWTELNDTSVTVAQARVSLSTATAEDNDSTTIQAAAAVTGSSALVEASDAAYLAGSVGSAVAIGASWAETSDGATISAAISAAATAAWPEVADTVSLLAASGNVVVASAALTEQSDSCAALATIRVPASVGWAEVSDLAGFSASVLAAIGIAWAESGDGLIAVGTVIVSPSATLGWSEDADQLSLVMASDGPTLASTPYPLAGKQQVYPLAGKRQIYPLTGKRQT